MTTADSDAIDDVQEGQSFYVNGIVCHHYLRHLKENIYIFKIWRQ